MKKKFISSILIILSFIGCEKDDFSAIEKDKNKKTDLNKIISNDVSINQRPELLSQLTKKFNKSPKPKINSRGENETILETEFGNIVLSDFIEIVDLENQKETYTFKINSENYNEKYFANLYFGKLNEENSREIWLNVYEKLQVPKYGFDAGVFVLKLYNISNVEGQTSLNDPCAIVMVPNPAVPISGGGSGSDGAGLGSGGGGYSGGAGSYADWTFVSIGGGGNGSSGGGSSGGGYYNGTGVSLFWLQIGDFFNSIFDWFGSLFSCGCNRNDGYSQLLIVVNQDIKNLIPCFDNGLIGILQPSDDPCIKLTERAQNQSFRDVVQFLDEQSYVMPPAVRNEVAYYLKYDNVSSPIINYTIGPDNLPQIGGMNLNGTFDAFLHNHFYINEILIINGQNQLVQSINTFTEIDLFTLFQLASNYHIQNVDSFIFGMVYRGKIYNLSINNSASFIAACNKYLFSNQNENSISIGFSEILMRELYVNQQIDHSNSPEINRNKLVKALNNLNFGLTMYEADTSNLTWKKLEVDSSGNVNLVDCN